MNNPSPLIFSAAGLPVGLPSLPKHSTGYNAMVQAVHHYSPYIAGQRTLSIYMQGLHYEITYGNRQSNWLRLGDQR